MAGVPKKPLAMLLSIIPGVGHYYLGAMNRGLQFMLLFFGSFFIVEWFIPMRILPFWLPVVWFYCLFDALQVADHPERGEILLVEGHTIVKNIHWIGLAVAVLGLIQIIEYILPVWWEIHLHKRMYFEWEEYRCLILNLMLIAAGVSMIVGSWINKRKEKTNHRAM